MPVPVFGGEAIVKDSLVYILGGYSDSLRRKVDLIQEYNPATNQWRLIGNMKLRRQGFFAGVHNDSVYIFGGVSGLTQFKDYLEMWSFSGGSGYLTLNPNFNRIYPSGEIYNNKLYLIGGLQNHKTDTLGINYLAEFDIPSRNSTT
jgi:N-acetylneuraminic acid mutarotase